MRYLAIFILISIFLSHVSYANHICHKQADRCVDGPSIKRISGFDVRRDCWKYQSTYKCRSANSKNNCNNLRQQGCFEISSKCKERYKGKCINLGKEFKCIREEKYLREEERAKLIEQGVLKGGMPYVCESDIPCLDGNCAVKNYEGNKEMLSSISQLSVLKEIQGQIKEEFDKLFKGQDSTCTKAAAGFKDCCATGEGWGVSLKLGHCNPNDRATATKSSKGLCHEIGTYCAEKVFLIGCIREKKAFCCFPSKLTKAIQEQGRKQLGISWGSPESPNCRGFTRGELTKIDFGQLDLSETYQDLLTKYKTPDMTRINESMKKKIELMQRNMKGDGR